MENRTKSKQFSMMNFVTRASASGSQGTSEESNSNSPNGEISGAERRSKFVWKSKKNSIDGNQRNQTVSATTNILKSSSTSKLEPHASSSYFQPTSMTESPTVISDVSTVSQNMSLEETSCSNGSINQSQNMFDDMDMEDSPAFEFPEVNFAKATSPLPRKKSSDSRSDSKTPSPRKIKSSLRSGKSQNKERTPDKPRSATKNDDPLRNLKLDATISGYLNNLVNHPALRGLEKDGNLSSKNNLEDCKTLYIELLEKISESFERIPQFIKEKLPGFNSTTYKKVLEIKKKFKTAINCQVNDKMSLELNKNKGSKHNRFHSENIEHRNTSLSLLNGYDNDFDRQSSHPVSSNECKQTVIVDHDIKKNKTVEKLDFAKKNNSKSSIYSEVPLKKNSVTSQSKSESIDEPRSKVDLKDFAFENSSKAKGKFVFKTPSRFSVEGPAGKSTPIKDVQSITFERLKNVTDKLKPITNPEPPKNVKPNNSSVSFQPQEFSRSSLLGYNKPCTIVSPIVNQSPIEDEDYDIDCEDVPLDLDDYLDDQNPEASKVSVINISDSLPSTSVDRTKLDQDVIVDDDGWPEYRIEDFEEDFGSQNVDQQKVEGPEVVNLMEQSFRDNQPGNKYAGMGDFHAGTKNDGVTGEFDGFHYPHSSLMMEMFSEKFGLKSFRPNQLQAINATLLGHDCFILMPTGGGKSLCYQLPAVLTPGVTIVISPLKSLILDQVNKLLSLDIPAAHLSGDISLAECDEIYHKLSTREPYYKLLYVTPEKICSSAKFQSMLDALYSRDKIARFVIDEAHCVSQWGHDFRPDYKKLQILRERFSKTTMMALTATANPRVRMDILHQLKVQSCKWFLCSFNRPNLAYRILEKKPKSVNEDVAKIIKNDHSRDSGIVYCLSRKECETLATYLKRVGISAEAYHAGLTDKKRETVQTGWVADRYKVICATIAFGMGVDKADVRFVIHHSMPKSVEGYYQETGRAGRDGERSVCVLFYSYCDVIRYRKLLDMERNASAEAKRVHVENLLRMVEVCESVSECRRAQVLSYLGERYNREDCKGTCDNCVRQNEYKPVDVTEVCKLIVRCIKDANIGGRAAYTLIHIADALRGSVTQRIQNLKKHPMHGKCKSWQRSDPLRLLRQMVVRGLLAEKLVVSNDIANAYIILGPNVDKLMSDSLRVVFPMKVEKPKPVLATTSAVTAKEDTPITMEIKRLEERCYADLVEACREMATQRGTSLAAVMPVAALKAMSVRLPERAEDMLAIPHVTRANYDKYGAGLLGITSQYSTEKLCLLMQHEDQMEAEAEAELPADEFRSDARDSDTDWGSLARGADASSGGGSQRSRRGYRRGGVRKRFRRAGNKTKAATAAKARALSGGRGARAGRGARGGSAPRVASPAKWKSTAGGTALGSMPVPRANNMVLNTRPGVFNPSKLNLI